MKCHVVNLNLPQNIYNMAEYSKFFNSHSYRKPRQTKLSPRKDVWMQACNIQSIRQKDCFTMILYGEIHCDFDDIILFWLKQSLKVFKKHSIHYKIDSQSMYTILEMIN